MKTSNRRIAEVLNMTWRHLFYPLVNEGDPASGNLRGERRICYAVENLHVEGTITKQECHDTQEAVLRAVHALCDGCVTLSAAAHGAGVLSHDCISVRESEYIRFRDRWLSELIVELQRVQP